MRSATERRYTASLPVFTRYKLREIERPGFAQQDSTVEVAGQRLIIRGEQKQASERRGDGYYNAERRYGAVTRVLPLPCAVDAEHMQTTSKHGVLRVTLPKTTCVPFARRTMQGRG